MQNALPEVYTAFLVIVGLCTAGISGLWLGIVMGTRWNLKGGYLGWICFASMVASATVMGIITAGAISTYGLGAGFLVNFMATPMVAIVWAFVVGGNKVVERILGNLLKKFNDATS